MIMQHAEKKTPPLTAWSFSFHWLLFTVHTFMLKIKSVSDNEFSLGMLTQQFLLFLKASFIVLQHLGLRKPAIITRIVILYEKKVPDPSIIMHY